MSASTVSRNPIFWRENTYFQRVARRWRRWEFPIALLLALFAFWFVVTILNSSVSSTAGRGARSTSVFFAFLTVWIFHGIVVVRAIIAGASVFSREHVGLTWDSLVLTGVSVRQILFGKLRATLRTLMPWMLLLGMLQLSLLPVFPYVSIQRFAQFCYVRMTNPNSVGGPGFSGCAAFDWVPWSWLAAPALTVALTMLDVAACVLIGLAASAVTRRSVTAAVLGLIVRFTPVAIFVGFAIREVGNEWFFRYIRYSPFTIADGGTSGLVRLTSLLTSWTQGSHEQAIFGLSAYGVIIVGLLAGAWVLTLRMIRRGGALTHAEANPVTAEPTPNFGTFRLVGSRQTDTVGSA